ncbi:unnamed protein product, partial [Ectocarpus fasciculatus]
MVEVGLPFALPQHYELDQVTKKIANVEGALDGTRNYHGITEQALLVQELISLRKKEEQIRELQLFLLKSFGAPQKQLGGGPTATGSATAAGLRASTAAAASAAAANLGSRNHHSNGSSSNGRLPGTAAAAAGSGDGKRKRAVAPPYAPSTPQRCSPA